VTEPEAPTLLLAELSTTALRCLLDEAPYPTVLWPVGSTEPHGPHLPLATDILLSVENARRAALALREVGVTALVAPPLPYGVTDFAEGFAGAVSVPREALIGMLVGGASSLLGDGFAHVCFVNHHLEPAHIEAVAEACDRIRTEHGRATASFPQVTSRRWGRTLTAEFRSGACHAGQYETSLVLAVRPDLVDTAAAEGLPPVEISLSDAIRAGIGTFKDAGADAAYVGRPADATADEGESTYAAVTAMVVTEVLEHLGIAPSTGDPPTQEPNP
jgi:creatinine amidohydrolase